MARKNTRHEHKQPIKRDAKHGSKRSTAAQMIGEIPKSDHPKHSEAVRKVASLCYELKDKNLCLQLLDQMQANQCQIDEDALRRLLEVAISDGDVLFQAQVLSRAGGSARFKSAFTYDALIQCMCYNLELERTLDTLYNMKNMGIIPTQLSYTTALTLALKFEDSIAAMSILEEMEKHNMINGESQNIYLQVLRAAALAEELKIAGYCWEKAVKEYDLIPDHGTLTYLLHLAAKFGSPKLGTQVLETMGNSDMQYAEHHLASLLQAFAMSGDLKGAFSMLQIIDSEGISTRKETALPIVHQLGTSVSAIEKAIQILKDLHAEGKDIHIAGFNGVLYAAARAKQIDMVKYAFSLAPLFKVKVNVDTYNCLLDASIYATDWDYGNEIWSLMKAAKIKPNSTSYSKMVVLCCTQDDYEDCFRYLEEMKYFKYVPPRGCYQTLIRKLANAADDRVHVAIEDMRACGYDVPEQIDRLIANMSAANAEEISRQLGPIDDNSVAAQ